MGFYGSVAACRRLHALCDLDCRKIGDVRVEPITFISLDESRLQFHQQQIQKSKPRLGLALDERFPMKGDCRTLWLLTGSFCLVSLTV